VVTSGFVVFYIQSNYGRWSSVITTRIRIWDFANDRLPSTAFNRQVDGCDRVSPAPYISSNRPGIFYIPPTGQCQSWKTLVSLFGLQCSLQWDAEFFMIAVQISQFLSSDKGPSDKVVRISPVSIKNRKFELGSRNWQVDPTLKDRVLAVAHDFSLINALVTTIFGFDRNQNHRLTQCKQIGLVQVPAAYRHFEVVLV